MQSVVVVRKTARTSMLQCNFCSNSLFLGLQAMLDVHVTAPFKLIQAVTPLMREAAKQEQEQQGEAAPRSIINISSTSGTHGNAGQANYAAGKAAIVGLTKVSSSSCC
jgi:NAD(P)-dependent dehydrogenase (short-subunit alcohol dehydrogenase family)